MTFALASQFHIYLTNYEIARRCFQHRESPKRGLLRDCEIFAKVRLNLYLARQGRVQQVRGPRATASPRWGGHCAGWTSSGWGPGVSRGRPPVWVTGQLCVVGGGEGQGGGGARLHQPAPARQVGVAVGRGGGVAVAQHAVLPVYLHGPQTVVIFGQAVVTLQHSHQRYYICIMRSVAVL